MFQCNVFISVAVKDIWPPCVRVTVVRSPVLQVGTLFIITADSPATVGRFVSFSLLSCDSKSQILGHGLIVVVVAFQRRGARTAVEWGYCRGKH